MEGETEQLIVYLGAPARSLEANEGQENDISTLGR